MIKLKEVDFPIYGINHSYLIEVVFLTFNISTKDREIRIISWPGIPIKIQKLSASPYLTP